MKRPERGFEPDRADSTGLQDVPGADPLTSKTTTLIS